MDFDYWDSRALDFHELEDEGGRRGLFLAPRRVREMLVVRYRALKATPPDKDAVPVSLGSALDRTFAAHLWP